MLTTDLFAYYYHINISLALSIYIFSALSMQSHVRHFDTEIARVWSERIFKCYPMPCAPLWTKANFVNKLLCLKAYPGKTPNIVIYLPLRLLLLMLLLLFWQCLHCYRTIFLCNSVNCYRTKLLENVIINKH